MYQYFVKVVPTTYSRLNDQVRLRFYCRNSSISKLILQLSISKHKQVYRYPQKTFYRLGIFKFLIVQQKERFEKSPKKLA